MNSTSEYAKSISNYAKLDYIPSGAKTIYSKLSDWATEAWKLLKEWIPKIDLNNIRKNIAKYGDKAVNLISLLKNIFDARGGDTLLINKVFEAIGKEDFGEFASTMGSLIKNKPEAFDDLNAEEVGKVFESFNGDSKGTIEALKNLENKDGKLEKGELMDSLNKGSLLWRANHYLGKAKEIQEKKNTGQSINQGELKDVIEKLKGVMKEIEELKVAHSKK